VKLALVASTSWSHYNSRLTLARALRDRGHEVVFLSPRDAHSDRLLEAGFPWKELDLLPRGRSILREPPLIISLAAVLNREHPDVLQNFTPKGVIYGSLAARLVKIPTLVNTITGRGRVFSVAADPYLRWLVTLLYRIALRHGTVVFQNRDDQQFFTGLGIVDKGRSRLIPGSGVDDEKFLPKPEPDGPIVVMLPSRLVEEKGIRDFVAAARILRAREPNVLCVLVGRPEQDQPTAIPIHDITSWVEGGLVEWWGWYDRMDQIFPRAHIVCLPTYYMEGLPKSLLEAGACGRPVIATDVPGCRDFVQDGVNGLLVPPRDPRRLADAIERLARDSNLRATMGAKGRENVSREYSAARIIPAYFEIYGIKY